MRILNCIAVSANAILFLVVPLLALDPPIFQLNDLHNPSPDPIKTMSPEPDLAPINPLPSSNQNLLMEKMIKDHLQAIQDGDSSQAYYAYTTASFQKAVPLSTFKAFVQANPILSSLNKFTFEQVTWDGLIAKVKGKLEDTYGGSAQIEYDLIQENGVWKIQRVDLFRTKGK